jgi:ABC-type branched-subunit amino acid transport system substrate-binding protein
MAKSTTSTKVRSSAALAAAAAMVAAAGCSSSGSTSNGGETGATAGGNKTITVGLLTDQTGPAASGNKTSVDGVKAGTYYAARNGYTVKYVVADTQTSPTGVTTAAKKLVTQDHVSAVLSVSSLTLLAAPYLTARGIPVIGAGEDGPEWTTAKNMFSVFGALNTTKVATTFGEYLKSQGVTSYGGLGYAVSPVSAESVKGDAASAEAAGIKIGYLNANFPFGSTNVAPVAIAMKNAGVDSFTAATDPNTAFSLITELKNQGVDLKASMLATGYGSDLTQAGAGALAAAQNVNFVMTTEPFAMNTAATQQMSKDMKSAGVPVDQPTYGQYAGYLSVGLLVQALQGSGGSTSSAKLIDSLSNIHDWNGVGLFGDQKVDINNRTDFVAGPNNCMWVAKLEGKTFTAVKSASPICGKLIPGKTVSSSS